MKMLAILFPLLLLLSNCNKEKEPKFAWDGVCIPIQEQQLLFPPSGPSQVQEIEYSGSKGIACLDVNPFDGLEFLLSGNPSDHSTNLYRYHVKTGERIYLPRDIMMTSQPRWSRKD